MEPGSRIGDRYVVTGHVGAGGMGVVVSARDEKLGRVVAIKVVPQSAIGDETARRRIIREARAAAGLDHRSIVHVYDVGEAEDGSAYFVMEHIRGKSLGTVLQEGTTRKSSLLAALIEAGRALAFAHEKGFVHRDIKPDNIMVRDDGSVVVLDFGLAKTFGAELAATAEAVSVTAKGGFVGTPSYVSPEQARGDDVDPATDQFALAVTVFEAMTGSIPWRGKTVIEVVSEILKGTPQKLGDLSPDLPQALDAAIARALEKDIGARFPSMSAFVDELERILPDMLGTEAPSATVPAAAASTSPLASSLGGATETSTPASAPAAGVSADSGASLRVTTPPKRRPLWPLVAIGVAAIGIFIAHPWRNDETPPPTPAPAKPAIHTVACPQLEVAGDEEKPTGWLGAAAANLSCERIQWMLGGRAKNTLVPAELLRLPREPKEGVESEPYDKVGVREKEIAFAKESADVSVTGVVEHSQDMHVVLHVTDRSGRELATAEGTHPNLLGAVRDATDALRAKGAFGPAPDLGYLHTVLPGATVDAALRLHDLAVFDLMEDDVDVRADCEALAKRNDLGAMATLVSTFCAAPLGNALGKGPAADDSTPIASAISVAVQRLFPAQSDAGKAVQKARIDALVVAANKEPDQEVRAILLGAAADGYYYTLSDAATAGTVARASVQASPRTIDLRGTAWHRQSFSSADLGAPVLIAHESWLPWEPFAQANLYLQFGTHAEFATAIRRASTLARHGYWRRDYGDWLARIGHLEEAKGIAVESGSRYLAALIQYAEGFPGRALATIRSLLAHMETNVENGREATRLAALGIGIAGEIGQPVDFADVFLDRFVTTDAPKISHGVTSMHYLCAVCMNMEQGPGAKCIERVRQLVRVGHFGGAFYGSTDLLEGSAYFVAGQYDKAAKTWRPLLSGPGVYRTEGVREQLSLALSRAGEIEMADKLDDYWLDDEILPEANAAHVRIALRLEKRGDAAGARRVAQRFVNRWNTADERPRGLAEMKRVLARTATAATDSGK